MTVIERFFEYLDKKGLKHTPIEKELGLSNGYLGKMLKRKGTIGDEVLQKIFSFFPELNIIWLMTGNGEMELSEKLRAKIYGDLSRDSEKIAGNSAGKTAGNSQKTAGKMAGNLDSDEKFPSDAGNGCPNCKKLENDIFHMKSTIEGRDVTIAKKDDKIETLNREIGRLEGEVQRLQAQIDLLTNKQDDVA